VWRRPSRAENDDRVRVSERRERLAHDEQGIALDIDDSAVARDP
jgi:hypothetical protein